MKLNQFDVIFLSDKELGLNTNKKGTRFSIIINEPMIDGYSIVIHTTSQIKNSKKITQFNLLMNEKSLITVEQTIRKITNDKALEAKKKNKNKE